MKLSAASIAAGLLLSLTFPPFGLDVIAWAAFVPFFHALETCRSPRRGAWYGGLLGLAFFSVDVCWIYGTVTTHGHFSSIPAAGLYVALVMLLSLYGVLFGFLSVFLSNRGIRPTITAPFLWTSLELARSLLFSGFPWDLVGYSQAHRLPLIQIADITGIYGISFVVLLVNAALWELIKKIVPGNTAVQWRLVGVACISMLGVLTYGMVRLDTFAGDSAKRSGFSVAVLQGNIPQELKWTRAIRQHTFDVYEALGKQAVDKGASLLVWPETSAPVFFGGSDPEWRIPGKISEKLGVPMLVGAPSEKKVDGRVSFYNSAFLVDGTMLRGRYDKIHLVPFGEYMPFSQILPLGPGIAAREADFSAGSEMTVMHYGNTPPFSVLICYEAIFPELARKAVQRGARMLINITNDGWFGDSAAPDQHLAMAGMRAVENRVWLLRAANTGISGAFDPTGKLVACIPLNRPDALTVRVSSGHPDSGRGESISFYSRHGDVFAWSCVISCILASFLVTRLYVERH